MSPIGAEARSRDPMSCCPGVDPAAGTTAGGAPGRAGHTARGRGCRRRFSASTSARGAGSGVGCHSHWSAASRRRRRLCCALASGGPAEVREFLDMQAAYGRLAVSMHFVHGVTGGDKVTLQ